jgi:DNA invertase Pin-like site-specific DNA recombinase
MRVIKLRRRDPAATMFPPSAQPAPPARNGRLTLNVLLSFAHFEREVTGERIRDKIAASKKKRLWMGGPAPLGYRTEGKKLVVDPVEAEMQRAQIDSTSIIARS